VNGENELNIHLNKLIMSATMIPPESESQKLSQKHDLLCQVDWVLKEILEQLEDNPEVAKTNVADALLAVRDAQDKTLKQIKTEETE